MKKKNAINRYIIGLLIGLCTLTACFEGEEGCLDVDSLNYDVSADEACADCCTYPSLSLTFSHKIYQNLDTLNFGYQTPYFNDFGQYFAFEELSYYISDVGFVNDAGTSISVIDLIDLAILENNDTTFFEVNDNFVFSQPDNFRAQEVGTFIYNGSVTALQFSLGLPEVVQQTEPTLLPDDHPLATQEPAMYVEDTERYLYNRIEFFRDTTDFTGVSEVIQITDEEDQVNVSLPVSGTIPSGFNVAVTIEVDYLAWFSGVDFNNDSNETIKSKIVANLADSFQVLAINLSQ